MKKRYTEEQIIGFLKEAEAGVAAKELCRRHGFSEASFYLWRSKYGGLEVSEVRRLKVLEIENTRLKKLLAESMLEQEVTREALRKSGSGGRAPGVGGLDSDSGTVRAAGTEHRADGSEFAALRTSA